MFVIGWQVVILVGWPHVDRAARAAMKGDTISRMPISFAQLEKMARAARFR